MMWHARCPVWIKEVCRTQLYRVLSFRIACLRILSPRTARSVLNCCTAQRVRTFVCMCDGVIQNCLCVEVVVQHCMICGTPSRSIACWESGNSFGGLPCPVVHCCSLWNTRTAMPDVGHHHSAMSGQRWSSLWGTVLHFCLASFEDLCFSVVQRCLICDEKSCRSLSCSTAWSASRRVSVES